MGDEVTHDRLLRGRVKLIQPARGFRSSLDPVLLAAFVAPPFGRFLDIGCGTGALSFLLLARDPDATGVAVEVQPRLAALAARGRDENGWQARLDIVEGDARQRLDAVRAAGFDLCATNPPFRSLGEGHAPPDRERAIAHHEVSLTLDDWVACAARAARPGGRVAAVFPAERSVELLAAFVAHDLAPARLRFVHPLADRPASRLLIEAERGGRRPLSVEPPLILHAEGERYTPEVLRMLGESD